MKKIIACMVCILLSSLMVAAIPTEGEEKLYDNVIRLHIIANSNSEEDQALKIKIRDRILLDYSDQLKSIQSIDAATETVTDLLEDINNTAKEVIKSE